MVSPFCCQKEIRKKREKGWVIKHSYSIWEIHWIFFHKKAQVKQHSTLTFFKCTIITCNLVSANNDQICKYPQFFHYVDISNCRLQLLFVLHLDIFNEDTWWRHHMEAFSALMTLHRSPVNSPHKGQWREALIFSLIDAWTNGWVNNRDAGGLRRHCGHYDVTVMVGQYPVNVLVTHNFELVEADMPPKYTVMSTFPCHVNSYFSPSGFVFHKSRGHISHQSYFSWGPRAWLRPDSGNLGI